MKGEDHDLASERPGIAEGLSGLEPCRLPFISERAVRHHVSAVLSKAGVASRTAAAREAARLGRGPQSG